MRDHPSIGVNASKRIVLYNPQTCRERSGLVQISDGRGLPFEPAPATPVTPPPQFFIPLLDWDADDLLPVDLDVPAVGLGQACDDPEESCLARAVPSGEADEAALVHGHS